MENLGTLPLLGVWALTALVVAWGRGLFKFRFQTEEWYRPPRFLQVVIAFSIYLGIQLIILPSLAVGWVAFSEGESHVDEELTQPFVEGWINFAGVCASLPMLILYAIGSHTTIWEKRTLTSKERWRNILFGPFLWLVAFPLVTFTAEGVKDLVRYFYAGPALDQVAVRHLKSAYGDPLLTGASILAIVLFVPIIEEMLFRGFLQSWLRTKISRGSSIFFTALMFTLVHYSPSQGIANTELLAGLFLLALFLGFIYERQQCLWPSIGLHCFFNTVSVTMILLGVTDV